MKPHSHWELVRGEVFDRTTGDYFGVFHIDSEIIRHPLEWKRDRPPVHFSATSADAMSLDNYEEDIAHLLGMPRDSLVFAPTHWVTGVCQARAIITRVEVLDPETKHPSRIPFQCGSVYYAAAYSSQLLTHGGSEELIETVTRPTFEEAARDILPFQALAMQWFLDGKDVVEARFAGLAAFGEGLALGIRAVESATEMGWKSPMEHH